MRSSPYASHQCLQQPSTFVTPHETLSQGLKFIVSVHDPGQLAAVDNFVMGVRPNAASPPPLMPPLMQHALAAAHKLAATCNLIAT